MPKSMLDTLVDSYAAKHFRPGMSNAEQNLIKKGVVRDVRNEILNHLEQEELAQIRQKVEEEETSFRNQLYQERISDLITEAIVIAIFVGLLVNQITVLIDAFRNSQPYPLWGSALLILIFIVSIRLIAKGLKWSRILRSKKKKESE